MPMDSDEFHMAIAITPSDYVKISQSHWDHLIKICPLTDGNMKLSIEYH